MNTFKILKNMNWKSYFAYDTNVIIATSLSSIYINKMGIGLNCCFCWINVETIM